MEKYTFKYNGKDVHFQIMSNNDYINGYHRIGKFYETKELEYTRRWIGENAAILDIGSNVGNNAVFYSLFMNPSKLILIEPNPVAIKYLRNNISLNNCNMDLTHLGKGISLDRKRYSMHQPKSTNLGWLELKLDELCGNIETVQIDDIIKEPIDFIKIDVEEMEMDSLKSASKLVKKYSPKILIEVTRKFIPEFLEYTKLIGYKSIHQVDYNGYVNYFIEKD